MTHLCTTRRPMSEARRQHIHGRLLPFERPDKEPSFLSAYCTVMFVIGVATIWIGVVS